MEAYKDYNSLVQGVNSLDFSGSTTPGTLLLIGDTAFPVVVTPNKSILIAASRYGKGKIVVLAHEAYLELPQLTDFLKNAVLWLKPFPDAVVGVGTSLSLLAEILSSSGNKTEKVTGLTKGLGVLCVPGYDDCQAKEIISFLKEGGGLLIGAQAYNWFSSHREDNLWFDFPGNKITSVAGIYFTSKQGEKENIGMSAEMPSIPISNDVDLSTDLKQLLKGIDKLDIAGSTYPSVQLVHSPLAFPVALTDTNRCFFGAAYYGKGRVFVGTHEALLSKPELTTFILNVISWLDRDGKKNIGVNKSLRDFYQVLRNQQVPCIISNLDPNLSVYCCTSYSDAEMKELLQFVAEGGGLIMAGQAWYFSYFNPDTITQYPGNKILNKVGLTISPRTAERKIYDALTEPLNTIYVFVTAIKKFLDALGSSLEIQSLMISWLPALKEDILDFMKLPATPLNAPLQQELVNLVKECTFPSVGNQNKVKKYSKESFLMWLAQEICCLGKLDDPQVDNVDELDPSPVTVQIDATNPGGNAWRSTGLYLPPQKTAVLVFPVSALGEDLKVQVGCHSDNLNAKKEFCRAPAVVRQKPVVEEKIVISNYWGGLVYVVVKANCKLGTIPVTVYGAQQAPTFINGQTTLSSWVDTIRNLPAPWAELITENIILTVPSDAIRTLDDPEALMSKWDGIMACIADLSSIPRKFLRPERFVADVQISAGWMHAGYPIMCHLQSAAALVDLEGMNKNGIWGPVHELGHNQQRSPWEFPPNTTEATCNLWSVYVHETLFNIPREKAHGDLRPTVREDRIKKYLQNGAKLEKWSVWTALETFLQLQEAFGWEPFEQLFLEYQSMPNVSHDKTAKMNLYAETFSRIVNKNLSPFLKSWGWPIEESTSQKLSTLPEWENPMKAYITAMKAEPNQAFI
ncbi:TRPM8 channel-associated factor homolog [Hyperolius riggenbachi]|uniref:TRPM8 channel-associated factor homolog n=1 Tax=Hyperolius riggenbachi TaxID=752182 RepID=UPI0035A3AF89